MKHFLVIYGMTSEKSKTLSNKEIAHLLRSVAASYTLSGENRFKIIAYQNAAGAVEHMTRELKDIWDDGDLKGIPGLGPSISSHLEELFKTGRSKHFIKVLKKFPLSVYRLMLVPSIGVKTAYRLVKEFHFHDPDTVLKDVKSVALKKKIRNLPTFGEKSEKEILRAITLFEESSHVGQRMPLPYAYEKAEAVIAHLKKQPQVERIDMLGSLRRMVATIGDIDIAVVGESKGGSGIVNHFTSFKGTVSIDNAGEKKASIIVSPNIRVDLRVQDKRSYGSMLQYFTGSKTHNIKLREYAMRKGLSLSEYGIKNVKTGKTVEFASEEALYSYLDLQYIPPELREGTDEVALAQKKRLPSLVRIDDLKGDLHVHSSYDLKPSHDFGANTYPEILQAATKKGYAYVGLSDHNPRQSGLTAGEIVKIMKKRKYYIDKLFSNKNNNQSKYFIGLETDILPDGALALPPEAGDYVDYLIVSVHSSFSQPSSVMTKRILKALSFPKVKILGHPTGRLLNKRSAIDVDWETIFKECKKRSVALEINSWPERLDLPDVLVRQARSFGLKFVIDTDAHAVSQMENLKYGVSVARRGWCTRDDILNTTSYNEFKEWLLRGGEQK